MPTSESESDRLMRDARALFQAGRFDASRALCERVLAAAAGDVEALHLAGLVAYREGRLDDATGLLEQALGHAPDFAACHANLGNVRKDAGLCDAAIASYRRALDLDPRLVGARNNLGVMLLERGELDAAAAHFTAVIEQQPRHVRAHFNLGNVHVRRGDTEAALGAWRTALRIEPDFGDALANAGLALVALGRPGEAVPLLRRRAVLAPDLAEAHADLALALHRGGELAAAVPCYERALALAPDDIGVASNFCALLQKCCDWERLARWTPRIVHAVEEGRGGVATGLLVSLPEFTPALQLAAARADNARRPRPPALAARRPVAAEGRLRIGYLSADFREHATAWLVSELIELHDRSRFDVALYSYGPDDRSAARARLARAADRFVDVATASDEAAARRIAGDGVDVLVDLNGNTDNGRMGIAAWRPAPVQVNWLGFPGTLGSDHYDYIVADRVVIPAGGEAHYAEAVVRLPDCYQCNDRTRFRPVSPPDRGQAGLPPGGAVLCCFNQSLKITAPAFALWLRVLAAVPDAVLWLLDDNPEASAALRRRAAALGIAAERIVFAPHRPHGEHLARYLAADLAIDTFPCTSHTTGSDALWVGCPLVTLAGETFASRVGASLLASVGMPENVAATPAGYEALLLRLLGDRPRIRAMRETLARRRDTAPLFDAPRFARSLERAYARMAACAAAGAPRAFDVEAPSAAA
jgi:predicted O-linked N-acetylglucosamine transferase (SPINDLY family)